MNIGENIKKIRIEKGITQKELAEKLGTSQQNLAQYERGKRNPKLETIEKIAKALECSLEDIVGRTVKQGAFAFRKDVISLFAGDASSLLKGDSTHVEYSPTNQDAKPAHTLAAHFDGDEYTEDELEEIRQFAEFIKNKRSKESTKVNAAHQRTDVEVTEDMIKHDDDIMDDDNF